MSTNLILDRESPVLRQIAQPVELDQINTPEIHNILDKIKTALHGEDDGVAIAAPQIGESLRIFVVNTKALLAIANDKKVDEIEEDVPDMVFINPEITKLSKKTKNMDEGCLSVRWLYGQVKRSEKATIRAYDENGKMFTKGASGLMAQIFQHEVDHLDGILFIDKATNVENIPPKDHEPKI